MHLRLHGQAAHPQSERQRDGEQLPALHVPWLPANSRHRCRQRSLPMVPVPGSDAALRARYLSAKTSPSPSSGAANTARKNWGLSTTTTGISIRLTESEAFTTYEVPIMTFLLLMKTSDKVFFNEEVLCNMQ